MPAVVTVIELVVSPVLHSKLPAEAVDIVELPQLSASVTTGADGVALGAAVPVPNALTQPFTVCLTVYVPAVVTVTEVVVAPLLQSKVPVAVVDKSEVPSQSSKSLTTGVDGVVLGEAVLLPGALVHPFTVTVMV